MRKFRPLVPDTLIGPIIAHMTKIADQLDLLYIRHEDLLQIQNPSSEELALVAKTAEEMKLKEKQFNSMLPGDYHHQSFKIKI